MGDEGGFRAQPQLNREALGFVMKAIEKAGYKPGDEIYLALDCAATEYFKDGKYHLAGEGKRSTRGEMAAYLADLSAAIRSSRSRTAWPRTTGTAGRH